MSVRIRLKRLGRKGRPFYRLCAMDARAPRDGKVIEELGYYDPMVKDVDARAILKGDRVAYWLGVGALPTEKAAVLIKKYGVSGTHAEQQKSALERIAAKLNRALPEYTPSAKPKGPRKDPRAGDGERRDKGRGGRGGRGQGGRGGRDDRGGRGGRDDRGGRGQDGGAAPPSASEASSGEAPATE